MQMESRAAFLCDSLVSSVYDTICFRNRRRTDTFRQHAALCVNDAGKKEMHYSTTNTHQRRLDKQDWHGRCWRIAPSHRQSRSYSDSVVAITSVTDECRKDRLQGRRVDLSGSAWRRSAVPAAVHAHRRHPLFWHRLRSSVTDSLFVSAVRRSPRVYCRWCSCMERFTVEHYLFTVAVHI